MTGLRGGEGIWFNSEVFTDGRTDGQTDRRTDGRNCYINVARCVWGWMRTSGKKVL